MLREPGPIRFESGAVPAHNGFRLDDNQRLLPPRPEPFQHRPEQPVKSSKSRLWVFSLQDRKLWSKREILQKQIMPRTKGLGYQDKRESQQAQHMTSLQSDQSKSDPPLT